MAVDQIRIEDIPLQLHVQGPMKDKRASYSARDTVGGRAVRPTCPHDGAPLAQSILGGRRVMRSNPDKLGVTAFHHLLGQRRLPSPADPDRSIELTGLL